MNKVILPVVVLAIGAAGYLFWAGQTDDMPAIDTAAPQAPAPAPATEETVQQAVDATQEAADSAAANVEQTVQDATEAARAAADTAAGTAREMADEAAQAVDTAVDSATAAATAAAGAAAQAVDSATQAARDALQTATGTGGATEAPTPENVAALAAVATSAGMTEAEVQTVLSVEGFDLDRATAVITASDLGDLRKTLLTTALEQAQGNPDLLRIALDQTRSALGM